jgi:predicted bacteriocin transport accessory protein
VKKIYTIFIIGLISICLLSCQKDEMILYHLSAGDTNESVKSRIYLKTMVDEDEITWTSSHDEIISTLGIVSRPNQGESSVDVTLEASIKDKTYTYMFTVMPMSGHHMLDLYPSLDDEASIITEITYEELITLLDTKPQALIYLGFESCPWCMEYLPIFHKLAKNTGHEVIYYYNFKSIRTVIDNELNPLFQAIVNHIDETFLVAHPSIPDLKWLYAPTFIGLKDGEIKGLFTGALDGHVAYETYLTKNQTEALKDIFRPILSAVKPEDPCGC